jgi:hypothetical protein
VTRPQLTNRYFLPRPLVRALERDPYSRGDCDISVTQLIQPPRKVELERQHASEMIEDASDRLYALYGQIAHTILERAADSSIVEKRLYAECLGWKISGQVDLIEDLITDYKLTTVWSVKDGHKQEYIDQLRILRWLCHMNGIEVKGLQNVLLFRDWRPSESLKYDWYPPKVLVMPVEMEDILHDVAFTSLRVDAHQQARLGGALPDCTDEERWLRNGKYIRCESYCNAAPFCQTWQNAKAENKNKNLPAMRQEGDRSIS